MNQPASTSGAGGRRAYQAPTLEMIGDWSTLTLQTSIPIEFDVQANPGVAQSRSL